MLLELASASGRVRIRALGLRMLAQCLLFSRGENHRALELYEQASRIHTDLGDELGAAEVEITRIIAFSRLGEYSRAIQAAQDAQRVFERHGEWRSLSTLLNNLSTIHIQWGDLNEAITVLEESRKGYLRLGQEGLPFLTNNGINRALVLGDLGRYRDSILAGQEAAESARQHEQTILVIIATHNLGTTNYMFGNFAVALDQLTQARAGWLEQGHVSNAFSCDRAAAECLLSLRRYREVLDLCSSMHLYQTVEENRSGRIYAYLYEAQAHHALGADDEASEALRIARELSAEEPNLLNTARFELVLSEFDLVRGAYKTAMQVAGKASEILENDGFQAEAERGFLIAARAADQLHYSAEVEAYVSRILDHSKYGSSSEVLFEAFYMLGKLADQQKIFSEAADWYRRSLDELDRLQAHTMVEHRHRLLLDQRTQAPYEAMAALCIRESKAEEAFHVIDRAKSRALRDLVQHRITVRVNARNKAETEQVEQLNRLRNRRSVLLRQVHAEHPENADLERIAQLEKEILGIWHQLLLHDEGYAEDAEIPEGRYIPARPDLPDQTLLVEYFKLESRYVAAVAEASADVDETIYHIYELAGDVDLISQLIEALLLNIRSVPGSRDEQVNAALRNAQEILRKLFLFLVEPWAEALGRKEKIIFVPHGNLHYLPFHALLDNDVYLAQSHEIRYLPAAALLKPESRDGNPAPKALVVGHSFDGDLPFTLDEARQVQAIWNGTLLEEGEATLTRVAAGLRGPDLIHIAAHGHFRADNPMFSGLALADAWLSALDVFDMELNASLVTLSACSTGRNLVGGGDELLGLTRAFLTAGARSLLLSHWAVDDRSTAEFMQIFYSSLKSGRTKQSALQSAQMAVFQKSGSQRHPYFWAPFFLIGSGDFL